MTFHPKPKKRHIAAAIVFGLTVLAIHHDLEPDSITMAQEQIHHHINWVQSRQRILLIGVYSLKRDQL